MKINIVIVAHKKRRDQAHALSDIVQANHICMDDGTLGVNANHRNAWTWHKNHPSDWAVVLEDDAVPCKEFRHQTAQALEAAPAQIVSLYLGRLCPANWQNVVESATERAEKEKACFIVGQRNLHAVGLACTYGNVKYLLGGMTLFGVYAVDDAISSWTTRNNIDVAYTWPSLVDHADGDSLVQPLHGDPRPAGFGRVAWKHGVRKSWNSKVVPLIVNMAEMEGNHG